MDRRRRRRQSWLSHSPSASGLWRRFGRSDRSLCNGEWPVATVCARGKPVSDSMCAPEARSGGGVYDVASVKLERVRRREQQLGAYRNCVTRTRQGVSKGEKPTRQQRTATPGSTATPRESQLCSVSPDNGPQRKTRAVPTNPALC